MKSALATTLIVCLTAAALPVAVRGASDAAVGPLARSAAREAARLASRTDVASGSQDAGGGRPIALKWSELAPMITARIVEVRMPGGERVRGEVISVRDDALLMDVRTSTNRGAYPNGSASIPRALVTEIAVERTRGSWGRNIGTIIGVLSGLVVGGYIAGTAADSAGTGIPLFLGIASGFTIGGYYLGRAADRKVTVIQVAP